MPNDTGEINSLHHKISTSTEAELHHLQASHRLNECSAHIQVYNSRSSAILETAQNGIEFIDAALKISPENPKYLNTKALLHADGLGDNKLGISILENAAKMSPNDIQIQQNIRALKKRGNTKLGHIPGIQVFFIFACVFVWLYFQVSNS